MKMKNSFAKFLMILVFASFSGAAQAQGKIIAGMDFNPKSDGFGFRNYGYRPENINELSAADLILMFGGDKVCIEGGTAENCALYETAARWMQDRIQALNGGHCDGFSVSAMRTWQKLGFKGKSAPKHWQESVELAHNLALDENLGNFIAYYHSLQSLKEVNDFRAESFKMPPTHIVRLLIESFQTKKDFYTLGVGKRINGKYSNGHSILPFAVEDAGSGVYKIHVYDNNFPGETKYVMVDGKNETWQYKTASNPNEDASDYVGSRTSKTLSLKRMSDRNLKIYECPFGELNRDSEGGESSTDHTARLSFSFNGQGDLLVTEPGGKKIGYDRMNQSEINQIAGAEIIYYDGGLALDYSPEYILPYQASAKKHYQILLSGGDLEQETKANLRISAPGFVVGFEDILLDPDEELLVSISPDGQTLKFTASSDSETPTIYITTADGPDQPSYSFEVGGVAINAGKTLTMSIDLEAGEVHFKDNDGNEDAYDIQFQRTNADGTKLKFEREDVNLEGNDSFEIDISDWDEDHPLCVEDDDDGDGFEDETCGDIDDKADSPDFD